jgi:hypothetical protein
MPNYFQLRSKVTNEAVPFTIVDEGICKALGIPCDEVAYASLVPESMATDIPVGYQRNWYDSIGYALAVGVPLEGTNDKGQSMEHLFRLNDDLEEGAAAIRDRIRIIINHLRENYTSDAWAMNGRG